MDKNDVLIPARDGLKLGARLYSVPGSAPAGLLIVSGATAVPQGFYRRYAEAAVGAGFDVLTYDYRGVGRSKPEDLPGFRARMRDWALLDMAAVVDWARDVHEARRVVMVGHSVGGQLAGIIDNPDGIDRMMTVSSQSGYWGYQGAEQKYAVALHVYLTMPLLTRVAGYMPWSWIGAGEDLPKGVAMEWAGWCRDRRYLLGDDTLPLERFANFRAPVLAYSIDDDKWGTRRSVDAMMRAYPNVERRHLRPRAIGVEHLGHMGYFRAGSEAAWTEGFEWLRDDAQAAVA